MVHVRHEGAQESAKRALVTYVRDNRAYRVRARHCVLACYNMMIPYLAPELPETQKKALHELVKTPLVYTSVAIRNSHAFAKLGVNRIYSPGSYHTLTTSQRDRRHRQLPQPAIAGRAEPGVDDEDTVQARIVGA